MALRPTPAIVEDDDQAKASDTADVGVGRQGCEAPKLRNLEFSATSEYRISGLISGNLRGFSHGARSHRHRGILPDREGVASPCSSTHSRLANPTPVPLPPNYTYIFVYIIV